ncbi:transposase [Streptomyces sp. NBRC 110611]|uniref:transposase n=1 Tax=Streptomyces sp. NBRC 110611 TaxID=1621259 RepID=UPI0008295A18|nr:transposase [Streptomyces sp. NBRC 110611]GAU71436.1 transposase [Streptomyces sp. NBRC 110611]
MKWAISSSCCIAASADARAKLATATQDWLDELADSGLAPLVSLAGALREDQHAVAQGITAPYNSGVNEGRITDVKLQQRLMAGRASVPLFRHRVVLIAHLRRRYADRPTVSPR